MLPSLVLLKLLLFIIGYSFGCWDVDGYHGASSSIRERRLVEINGMILFLL